MASFKLEPEHAARIIEATTCTIFNEHDPAQRRRVMEQNWASDIICFSPFGAAAGYDEIDQVWAGMCNSKMFTTLPAIVFYRYGHV